MKYNVHLSSVLKQDIFIMNSGAIYLQQGSNMKHIGSTASTVAELRSKIEEFI